MFNMLWKKLPKFAKKSYTHKERESVKDSVPVLEQLEWQSHIENHDGSTVANSAATTEFQDEILETLLAPVAVLIKQDIAQLWKVKTWTKAGYLVNYKPNNWIKERPLPLRKLLEKLTIVSFKNEHVSLKIAYLTEQLYSSRKKRLVLPLSFRHNIFTYSFSHSRSLIGTNNSFLPAWSNTYLTNWFNKKTEIEILFPDGLIKVVFDNEQVIGKNCKVKFSGILVRSSVITSKAYLKISDSGIQGFADMKPKYWFFSTNDDVLLILESLNKHQNIFRVAGNAFIIERIQLAERQQNMKPLTKL